MSSKKRPIGLGRGLEVLLGPSDSSPNTSGPADVVRLLRMDVLQAGQYQPRTRMDEGALAELAESIKVQGVMQPILVRPVGAGRFEIIAGERRFRASQLAGLEEVPVLVKDVADEAAMAMALIENIQREDLNPLEEAQGVMRLIEEFNLSHEAAARAIGRSRSATSNLLRLLNLAQPVQTMLLAGDIEMGHARALLALPAAEQMACANQVINQRLNVRETEKLVARWQQEEHKVHVHKKHQSPDTLRIEEQLSDWMGARVILKSNPKGKGMISVSFNSHEELEGLLEKIGFKSE